MCLKEGKWDSTRERRFCADPVCVTAYDQIQDESAKLMVEWEREYRRLSANVLNEIFKM
jgi:hypothetical protein